MSPPVLFGKGMGQVEVIAVVSIHLIWVLAAGAHMVAGAGCMHVHSGECQGQWWGSGPNMGA